VPLKVKYWKKNFRMENHVQIFEKNNRVLLKGWLLVAWSSIFERARPAKCFAKGALKNLL
jgi:hypothetical protein